MPPGIMSWRMNTRAVVDAQATKSMRGHASSVMRMSGEKPSCPHAGEGPLLLGTKGGTRTENGGSVARVSTATLVAGHAAVRRREPGGLVGIATATGLTSSNEIEGTTHPWTSIASWTTTRRAVAVTNTGGGIVCVVAERSAQRLLASEVVCTSGRTGTSGRARR